MEGQLAVHLPGTDPEEPAKLTDCEILNVNKKKNIWNIFLLQCVDYILQPYSIKRFG